MLFTNRSKFRLSLRVFCDLSNRQWTDLQVEGGGHVAFAQDSRTNDSRLLTVVGISAAQPTTRKKTVRLSRYKSWGSSKLFF